MLVKQSPSKCHPRCSEPKHMILCEDKVGGELIDPCDPIRQCPQRSEAELLTCNFSIEEEEDDSEQIY